MKSFTLYSAALKQQVTGTDIASIAAQVGSLSAMFNEKNGAWWLHGNNPSTDEVRALSRALALHAATVDEILFESLTDKFEEFDSYIFSVFRLTDKAKLCVVTTAYGVLTIHLGTTTFEELHPRLDVLRDLLKVPEVTPRAITYALLDVATDSFMPEIVKIGKEASVIEKALFQHDGQSDTHELLLRMCKAREACVELMNLFQGKSSLLRAMIGYHQRVGSDTDDSMRLLVSASGHLSSMLENVLSDEAVLARSFVNYISIMRVKMVHSNSSMEQIAGAVALIGLVLLPSHLVTSAWAMNVPVPGQNKDGEFWFWGVIGVMSAVVLGCGVLGLWYYRHAVSGAQVKPMVRHEPARGEKLVPSTSTKSKRATI